MTPIQYRAEDSYKLPAIKGLPRLVTISTGLPASNGRPAHALNLNNDDLVRVTNRKARLFNKLEDLAIPHYGMPTLQKEHGPDFNQLIKLFGENGATDYRHATGKMKIDGVSDFMSRFMGNESFDPEGVFTQQIPEEGQGVIAVAPALFTPKPGKEVPQEVLLGQFRESVVTADSQGNPLPQAEVSEELLELVQKIVARMTLDYFVLSFTLQQMGMGAKLTDIHTRLIPQASGMVEKMIRFRAGQSQK